MKLPRELVTELLESSNRMRQVTGTVEILVDKQTMRRLSRSKKQLKTGRYKVASTPAEIDRILSS